jgi:hypothetical protein
MGKINRSWHEKNVMPKNATLKQRTAWHLRHAKACACRPVPATLLAGLNELKKKIPN